MRVRLHSLVLATLVLCIWKADSLNYCRPSMSCWPSIIELSNFKREMNATGAADVLTKDDSDWPTEGLTFNLAVTEVPGLIVYVESVDTIRKALQFATKYNIEISIISSGHSFPGRCTAKDSMQISVHKMKEITVDMGCEENNLGCLTAQSGVQWGEVYREANRHSRLVVGGSNPTVSVTGWTLGGGHSPMSRMFGLGVDNVISFHLISSDLSEVWASEKGVRTKSIDGSETSSNDTSLFWALRGGGSAFGVIVDITFRMHMDNQIAQMACSYPAYGDGFSETFRVMFNSLGPLLTQAPNTFSGYILPSVGCDPVSRACGGTSVISIVHYGPSNGTADDEWIKKFTDLPHDWIASGLTNGSCFLKEYPSFYDYELSIPNVTYTAEYLGGSLVQQDLLSNSFTNTIVRHLDVAHKRAKVNPAYNLFGTAIWVGGAVKNTPVNAVPVHEGWRNAIFSLSFATIWDIRYVHTPPALQIQGVKDLHKDLARYSHGKYYNEAEADMTPSEWKKEFWGESMYEKLLRIKKSWDPKNMFTCTECVGFDWDPVREPANGVVG